MLFSMFIILAILLLVIGAMIGFIKFAIKLVAGLALIYLLFNAVFVWNSSQLNSKLHLNQLVKPSVSQQIDDGYNSFTKMRSKNSVVDAKQVDSVVQNTLKSEAGKVNGQELARDIGQELRGVNAKTVQESLNNLQGVLAQYGIKPQDIENARNGN